MGTSTDGQICYGIMFEEGIEFPWSDKYEDDIESWWLYEVCKYKPAFEIYDSDGEYLDGKRPSEERVLLYYQQKREFEAAHPMPVKVVNYCSYEYPMYILAVPSTCLTNSRGYPAEFDPSKLVVSPEEAQALWDFCENNGIAMDEPGWYLSSFYGV